MVENRQIHIISGPNGAGKSSHARITLLPQFLQTNEFVNADEIAKVISPHNVAIVNSQAGRLMLKRINFLINSGMNFAFETTLSAKSFIKLIKFAKKNNYSVNLLFLALENSQLAINRVENRVSKGGHNVDSRVIVRRFNRGLENLSLYLKEVDTALIYNASGLNLVEIAKKVNQQLIIVNQNLWNKLYVE